MVENKKIEKIKIGIKYMVIIIFIMLSITMLNLYFFKINLSPSLWTLILIYIFYIIQPSKLRYKILMFIPLLPIELLTRTNILLMIIGFLVYSMYCTFILLIYVKKK